MSQNLPHQHGSNEAKIRAHLPSREEVAGVAEAMKQLGIPPVCRSSGFMPL